MARMTAMRQMPKGGTYQPGKSIPGGSQQFDKPIPGGGFLPPRRVGPGFVGPGKLTRLSPGVYRNAAGELVDREGMSFPGSGGRRSTPTSVGDAIAGIGYGLGQGLTGKPMFAGGTPNFDERTGQRTDGRNPELERIAQERAAAIQRGDMVTQDYVPERDRRVDEILGRTPQSRPRIPQMGPPLVYYDQSPVAGGAASLASSIAGGFVPGIAGGFVQTGQPQVSWRQPAPFSTYSRPMPSNYGTPIIPGQGSSPPLSPEMQASTPWWKR